jgi:hypothetical protein
VARRPDKGANVWVEFSAPLSNKDRAHEEGKGGRGVKTYRELPPPQDQVPHKGEGRHGGQHCWRTLGHSPAKSKKPNRSLCQYPLFDGSNTEAHLCRRTFVGGPADVSGPLSGTPFDTTSPSAQLDKVVPLGERHNKTSAYVSGVRNVRKFLDWIRAKYGKLVT